MQMLPDSVGNLTNFQSIDFTGCFNLQMFPDAVGNFTDLQSIELTGLQMLPDSVGKLTNLQSIGLPRAAICICFPDSVGNLNLQNIDLDGCSKLQFADAPWFNWELNSPPKWTGARICRCSQIQLGT